MRSLKMKTCVIIPTYNESKTIGELVKQIRQHGLEVVVIDDGSADFTASIAQDSGATVLISAKNEGKGISLIKGFNYALSKDYDAVITMDGDGQHLPQDLDKFMRLSRYSDSGIFIGNRMLSPRNMPLVRVLTNKLMSRLISYITKQDIPDTQCGFRLIRKGVLKNVRLVTSKYETESELLIKASALGFRITSVPIKSIYRGEKSQINPFTDTLRFIKFILNKPWTVKP